MQEPDDPRAWRAAAPAAAMPLHALARDALDASTRLAGDRSDAALRAALEDVLRAQDGARLAAVFDSAPGAAVRLAGDHESVHLRFLVGAAIAAAGVDLYGDAVVGGWGVPLAKRLGTDIARAGATVLALPHAPRRLVPALQAGLGLQREVSA